MLEKFCEWYSRILITAVILAVIIAALSAAGDPFATHDPNGDPGQGRDTYEPNGPVMLGP